MGKSLTIALAQMSVKTADPAANLAVAEGLVDEARQRGAELVCFPELWTTGFQWEQNDRLKDRLEGDVGRIADMAARHRIWISGSVLAPVDGEKGKLANTLLVFDPTGKTKAVYRKIHLFGLMRENEHLRAGDELVMLDAPWGKTGLATCYDLRFGEMFGVYARAGAHVQLISAAWPHPRQEHWRTLLRARAIEQQMFVVAVNQAGDEDFGAEGKITYCGRSAIIDPWGNTVVEAEDRPTVVVATIDPAESERIRRKIPVLTDRRPDLY
ncbi:MAG: carbon-nitrogen family hydrolase [Phycisphaerales bacterium]|jgi:predicted amidohydrolase|nr:carbon-nitrogen family hydrolase [Phycisphaerales bacterium]